MAFDKEGFLRDILAIRNNDDMSEFKSRFATAPMCTLRSKNSPLNNMVQKTLNSVVNKGVCILSLGKHGYYCYSITNIIFEILTLQERTRVLEHIQTYSSIQTKWHILTDVDDTIMSSVKGGTNVKYQNHTVYPGVVSFYKHVVPENDFITLVSARPEVLAKESRDSIPGVIYTEGDNKGLDMLAGQARDITPGAVREFFTRVCTSFTPSFMYFKNETYPSKIGHLNGSDQILWYTTYKSMGETKFESIQRYILVFPEFKFIFIGDSGQGDLICSYLCYRERVRERDLFGSDAYPVKACFIHNILKSRELDDHKKGYETIDDFLMIKNQTFRKNLKDRHIYMFNNYIDLAGYLSCIGMITNKQLQPIVRETLQDFQTNKIFQSYYDTDEFREYLRNDIDRAVARWSIENSCEEPVRARARGRAAAAEAAAEEEEEEEEILII